jgi:hypothetical protein
MVEEVHQSNGQPEHPEVQYERTDANFRAILFIILGTMALAALIQAAVLAFFYDYRDYQAEIKKSPYPLAPTPSTALPAEPRLEQVDRLAGVETPDVYQRMESKEKVLNSYGDTPEKGFVHIPIERAMKLLENKLPARPAPQAEQVEKSSGLVDAGESNSGRMFRKGAR